MIYNFEISSGFATSLDNTDSLSSFRSIFLIPQTSSGENKIYFNGNSLGLPPKNSRKFVNKEFDVWEKNACDGHEKGKFPWIPYHEFVADSLSKLTGAKASEVVAMNSLTVNLHLMMVSFYRPTQQRYKILIEKGAFPSDRYAVISQLKFHGYNECDLIEVSPKTNQYNIDTDDFLKIIEQEGEQIALILLGGVQYYTGQVFDMPSIITKGHELGCTVGLDLAHAVGNIPLELNKWKADFAVWCSYKYLNGGPGTIGGAFIHEKHHNSDLVRFCGWWGHDKKDRFKMLPDFVPIRSVEGWQLSNPPIFQLAALRASLDIFEMVGINALRQKAIKLTSYLEFLLKSCSGESFSIITPEKIESRGCQLSLKFHDNAYKVFEYLYNSGVLCDYRHPNVIRVAPVPLYNTFSECYRFFKIIEKGLVL